MRSRYRIVDQDGLYFLTCTIVDWIPVFQSRPYFDIITQSLAFCRANKDMRLYAYVIMENHLHLIAGAPDLSGVMRAFKGFTEREIVALAEATGRAGLLNEFMLRKKRNPSFPSSRLGNVPAQILVPRFPFGNALLRSSALHPAAYVAKLESTLVSISKYPPKSALKVPL